MRHHRRAQDAGAEEHALGAVEAGHQKTGRDAADGRTGEDRLEHESGHDHADKHRDHGLETAKAA